MAEYYNVDESKQKVLALMTVSYSRAVLAVKDDVCPPDDMVSRFLTALEFFGQCRLGRVGALRSKDAHTPRGRLREHIRLQGNEEVSRRFIQNLPKNAQKILQEYEFGLWEVIQFTGRELLHMNGFGPKARKDVEEAISKLGLEFGTSVKKIHSDFDINVEEMTLSAIFDRGMSLKKKKFRSVLHSE